jgi:hypothetical protein
MYIGKWWYEIQEQNEVPVWYTGTYRPISSNAYMQAKHRYQTMYNISFCVSH